MITITFNYDQLRAGLAQLSDDEIKQRMEVATDASMQMIRGEIVRRLPVNTGLLRGSVSTSLSSTPFGVKGEVFSPLVYAVVVERGRRPSGSYPPRAPIVLWIQRKLGKTRAEAEALYYVIARKIAWKGIKGTFVFRDVGREAGQLYGRLSVTSVFRRYFNF